jgi:hypothetical protein
MDSVPLSTLLARMPAKQELRTLTAAANAHMRRLACERIPDLSKLLALHSSDASGAVALLGAHQPAVALARLPLLLRKPGWVKRLPDAGAGNIAGLMCVCLLLDDWCAGLQHPTLRRALRKLALHVANSSSQHGGGLRAWWWGAVDLWQQLMATDAATMVPAAQDAAADAACADAAVQAALDDCVLLGGVLIVVYDLLVCGTLPRGWMLAPLAALDPAYEEEGGIGASRLEQLVDMMVP